MDGDEMMVDGDINVIDSNAMLMWHRIDITAEWQIEIGTIRWRCDGNDC